MCPAHHTKRNEASPDTWTISFTRWLVTELISKEAELHESNKQQESAQKRQKWRQMSHHCNIRTHTHTHTKSSFLPSWCPQVDDQTLHHNIFISLPHLLLKFGPTNSECGGVCAAVSPPTPPLTTLTIHPQNSVCVCVCVRAGKVPAVPLFIYSVTESLFEPTCLLASNRLLSAGALLLWQADILHLPHHHQIHRSF